MNEWISVKDRVPEKNQRIIARTKSTNPDVEIQIYRWFNGDEQEVTHWMPIPEPPKE